MLDTVVDSAIDTLMLNVVIEALLVSLVGKVSLNLVLLGLNITISQGSKSWILSLLHPFSSFLEGGHSGLLIRDDVELWLEVNGSGSWSTDLLGLDSLSSAVTLKLNWDLVQTVKDLEHRRLLEHTE